MRAIAAFSIFSVSIGSNALAAGGSADAGGGGLLVSCFLSFCALVALSQVVPVVRLVAGMLKGLFYRT